jgi:hypothetical protein
VAGALPPDEAAPDIPKLPPPNPKSRCTIFHSKYPAVAQTVNYFITTVAKQPAPYLVSQILRYGRTSSCRDVKTNPLSAILLLRSRPYIATICLLGHRGSKSQSNISSVSPDRTLSFVHILPEILQAR